MGITQYISQGEGEQGDPLMPLFFTLGQRRALEAIHENMRPGEHVMAFSDGRRARSTSANFDFGQLFFRVRPIRLRPISTC